MPYESLACPRCGSGSFQEVKSNTYFCNHCDNVFKYTRVPSAAGESSPAACDTCGVLAVGLCYICNSYFCNGHQAVRQNLGSPVPLTRFANICARCYPVHVKAEKDKKAEYSRRFGSEYLRDFAHQELEAAGLPSVLLVTVEKKRIEQRFGRTHESADVTPAGHGWLLGEFYWGWGAVLGSTTATRHNEKCQTVLQVRTVGTQLRRVVEKITEGYVVGDGQLRVSTEEICRAIHQLAGTS